MFYQGSGKGREEEEFVSCAPQLCEGERERLTLIYADVVSPGNRGRLRIGLLPLAAQ